MLYVTQLEKVRISLDIQPLESFCGYRVKKLVVGPNVIELLEDTSIF